MKTGFLWGASTSSHQVEGGNVNNNWWKWEMQRPLEMRSGKAASHYDLWQEDFALAKQMGHTAHRFSIEWSRIEPKRSQWDKQALAHYREVLTELNKLNIVPFVTLHHFTDPQWFSDSGGWLRPQAPAEFARYAKVVVEHLGDLVSNWVTINEPVLLSTMSYWQGRWPPQQKGFLKFNKATRHLAKAHRRAYREIHSLQPHAQVGAAKHMISYVPTKDGWHHALICKAYNWWFNDRFMKLIWPKLDYVGVNYYFQRKVGLKMKPPFIQQQDDGDKESDLGWKIKPEGLFNVLNGVKKYKLPVYVTENGLADEKDALRADFIRDHLRAVERAQREGVDVRGYFHWSLLDNYEWDLGFGPRFGLAEVDYKTMKRKMRPSAHVYKAIIEAANRSE
jgi:beta-glucosidase